MIVNGVENPKELTKEQLLLLARDQQYGLKEEWITEVKEDFTLHLEAADESQVRYAQREGDKTIRVTMWKGLLDNEPAQAVFNVEYGKFRFGFGIK